MNRADNKLRGAFPLSVLRENFFRFSGIKLWQIMAISALFYAACRFINVGYLSSASLAWNCALSAGLGAIVGAVLYFALNYEIRFNGIAFRFFWKPFGLPLAIPMLPEIIAADIASIRFGQSGRWLRGIFINYSLVAVLRNGGTRTLAAATSRTDCKNPQIIKLESFFKSNLEGTHE